MLTSTLAGSDAWPTRRGCSCSTPWRPRDGPSRSGEIVDRVGVGQSTVSHHLRVLAEERFVHMRADGTRTLVTVNPDCLQALPEAAARIMGLRSLVTSLPAAALLIAEMVALLLAVTFGVTLLQRRLGDATIRRWMGGPPKRAALKGRAVGFITPFCTYSAIPVLVGMRQAGVRPAGYAAFIFRGARGRPRDDRRPRHHHRPRGSGRLRHHRLRGSLPPGSHSRRGRHRPTPQAGPRAGRAARSGAAADPVTADRSDPAADLATAHELFVTGGDPVGRMADRVTSSVAPGGGASEKHGLADRRRCGHRTGDRPARPHRRPRRHRRRPQPAGRSRGRGRGRPALLRHRTLRPHRRRPSTPKERAPAR
ncbi:MAG: ArsR family transcriptional regulator [Acidimicrobiaceae bacterium]|nr:ArsR family transcriptional regulator [Acidimicrobiaceae bacterium]